MEVVDRAREQGDGNNGDRHAARDERGSTSGDLRDTVEARDHHAQGQAEHDGNESDEEEDDEGAGSTSGTIAPAVIALAAGGRLWL